MLAEMNECVAVCPIEPAFENSHLTIYRVFQSSA